MAKLSALENVDIYRRILRVAWRGRITDNGLVYGEKQTGIFRSYDDKQQIPTPATYSSGDGGWEMALVVRPNIYPAI